MENNYWPYDKCLLWPKVDTQAVSNFLFNVSGDRFCLIQDKLFTVITLKAI